MSRAFYRVPVVAIEGAGSPNEFDVRLLYTSGSYHYVMAPLPRPGLAAALGADFLGSTWEELWANALTSQVRSRIFKARVRRHVAAVDQPVMLLVAIIDIQEGDEVLAQPIPPVRYAGDPPLRPLQV